MTRYYLPNPARRPLGESRRLAWASAAYLALATYGSLVPLRFQPIPFDEAWERFQNLPWTRPTFTSRSDWAVNILLFVPFGYLLTGLIRERWPRVVPVWAGIAGVVSALVCASAIEFSQTFFPPRNPSPNDVIALTLGASVGSFLWLVLGSGVANWSERLGITRGPEGWAGKWLLGYLVLFAFMQLIPMDLATSPSELVHKFREGRIQPIPFSTVGLDPWAALAKAVEVAAGFAPIGWLLAVRLRSEGRWAERLRPFAWAIGLVLAGGAEFAQIFVLSRYADATDVLTGGLGFLGGWLAGRKVSVAKRGGGRGWALAGWAAAAVVVAWQPFGFDRFSDSTVERLGGLWGVPFADYQTSNDLRSLDQGVQRVAFYAILGLILASRDRGGRTRVLAPALLTGLAALILESGQGFLPGRYPSLTDVLLGSIGGCVGATLWGRATSPARTPPFRESSWTR